MNRMLVTSLLTAVLGAGLAGCSSRPDSEFLPVPPEIAGGPELDSVPDDATRVAVMSGTGSFTVPVYRGQRWFLVDEKADQLLASDVAANDGELEVGRDGATVDGRRVWDGKTENVDNLALYLMSRREQL